MMIDRDRFLLGMVLGALLLVVFKISEFSGDPSRIINYNVGSAHYVSAATTSASLSITPTSNPSQIPLSGYCLEVPVILYHHVQPQARAIELGQSSLSVDNTIFENQMAHLVSNGYTTISAVRLADALRLRSLLPEKSIVVTFDDGYVDAYTYVYPIVQKYNVIANFAISTGLVGGDGYLTWEQIKEMSANANIHFANHTWSHYPLDQGSLDKIKFEVETANHHLEENTGQSIETLVYPYGSFDEDAIKVLQENGFKAAFSTIPGYWQCDSFIMSLHRNRVGNSPLSEYGL